MRWIGLMGIALTAAAAPAGERVIDGDRTARITVNGQAGRVLVDPGAPGLMLLSPEFAARAQLKGGGLFGFGVGYSVGSERVYGRTAVARIGWDDAKPARHRLGWTARAYLAGHDAVIGPAGLPDPVVRFQLRRPAAGERTVALPLAPTGGLFSEWFNSHALITVAGAPVRVRFDPNHRRTLATAVAARGLALANGGRLEGAVSTQEIAFGIARPVRTMRLARPLAIGPLALTTLGVRTADTGSVATIPEETDAPPADADPDEVVVTAKGKRKPRQGRIILGADNLSACSAIVFDKPRGEVRLTCR